LSALCVCENCDLGLHGLDVRLSVELFPNFLTEAQLNTISNLRPFG
jgi:hypothetical protein